MKRPQPKSSQSTAASWEHLTGAAAESGVFSASHCSPRKERIRSPTAIFCSSHRQIDRDYSITIQGYFSCHPLRRRLSGHGMRQFSSLNLTNHVSPRALPDIMACLDIRSGRCSIWTWAVEARAASLNVTCSCSWVGSNTVAITGDMRGPLRTREHSAADTSSCLSRAAPSAVQLNRNNTNLWKYVHNSHTDSYSVWH